MSLASPQAVPTRAVWTGSLGFALASLAVFTTVAFGEGWMYQSFGLYGAYLAWTALFILLGGAALRPLAGWTTTPRFFLLFACAFFAYAVGWTVSYFMVRGPAGEWVGAVAATFLMAFVLCAARSAWSLLIRQTLVLLLGHVVGYFLGSMLNGAIGGPRGMLLWGAAYGLGLGFGLAVALVTLDRDSR